MNCHLKIRKDLLMDKRDEMDLMGITDVRRVYDYLPYSHQRIKRILAEDYGCHLENVWQGYKGNRHGRYVETYNMVSNATGEVIAKNVVLDQFRRMFAAKNYPLYDDKSIVKKQGRDI